jgi:hypothetical protein
MIVVEYCTEVAIGKTDVSSPFTAVEYCVVVSAATLVETWETWESAPELVATLDSTAGVPSGEISVPLGVALAILVVMEGPFAATTPVPVDAM